MPDVRALELLIKAANQFRFYESQHRAKTDAKDLSDVLVEETVAKADVNAAFAHEIEVFLRDVTPAQVVRSPDAGGGSPTMIIPSLPVLRTYIETLALRDPGDMVTITLSIGDLRELGLQLTDDSPSTYTTCGVDRR